MTLPSREEVDDALDALDWMPSSVIQEIRQSLARGMRAARTGRSSGQPVSWSRIEAAVLYILFVTSDEYLARQM